MPQQEDFAIAEIVSEKSAVGFERKYADLLACFDAGLVFSAIASYLRLEGIPKGDAFTVPALVKATEDAFLTLLKRGALDEFVRVSPLPAAAQAELDSMSGITKPVVDPVVEVAEAQSTAIAECAKDYRSLGGEMFKRKWMDIPERRQIYEAAIGMGQV